MNIPVIFRADRHGDFRGEVTAVLPTLEANRHMAVCYAHIGQHGECSIDWYRATRPAKPDEYASLLRELQGIYEGQLYVAQRRNARNRA